MTERWFPGGSRVVPGTGWAPTSPGGSPGTRHPPKGGRGNHPAGTTADCSQDQIGTGWFPDLGTAGNGTRTAGRNEAQRRAVARLIETITGTGGGTRADARTERCARCRAETVRGLDGILCAFDVRLDPVPLSPLGEAAALTFGRYTWSLTLRGVRTLEISPRDPWSIAALPAGTLRRADVLTRHVCGRPWPLDGPLTAPSQLPDRSIRAGPAGDVAPPF